MNSENNQVINSYKEGNTIPFVEINVKNEIEKQRHNNPNFKKTWDESRAEYKLKGEMISVREHEKITQKIS